ncbi:MAG: hypothetical protein Unbinned2903contig1001_46 [Prokaryotic dsDNA virus sp.]|nr:MAG: hypothetical protein Unbinned2903contig1001_46 [Prokaryotic dsDNA virus sp.]|tara:strand:+ start:14590 stop:14778 length:189 start_codon:yes stop_codon:yes gene_type:complete
MSKEKKLTKLFKKIVLGDRLKEDNFLYTKDEEKKIKDLVDNALKWDHFNLELYTKIINFRNS